MSTKQESHPFELVSSKIEYIDSCFEDFKCAICLCPALDPVLCPNDHIFCGACFAQNYEYRKECPQCNIKVDVTEYRPAVRPIQNLLDNLKVWCLYKDNGCHQQMSRIDLNEHIKNCECAIKKCEVLVLTKDGQLKLCDHHYPIEDGHFHCKYNQYGCQYFDSKSEMKKHCKVCVYKNLMPYFKYLMNQIDVNNATLTNQIKANKNTLNNHQLRIDANNTLLINQINDIKIDANKIASSSEIDLINAKIGTLLTNQIKNLQSQITHHDTIFTNQAKVNTDYSTTLYQLQQQINNKVDKQWS